MIHLQVMNLNNIQRVPRWMPEGVIAVSTVEECQQQPKCRRRIRTPTSTRLGRCFYHRHHHQYRFGSQSFVAPFCCSSCHFIDEKFSNFFVSCLNLMLKTWAFPYNFTASDVKFLSITWESPSLPWVMSLTNSLQR